MKLLLVVEKDAILVVCNRLPKMAYFIATIEGTLVKGLARDNIWKLYGLLKSIINNRRLQFVVELTSVTNLRP